MIFIFLAVKALYWLMMVSSKFTTSDLSCSSSQEQKEPQDTLIDVPVRSELNYGTAVEGWKTVRHVLYKTRGCNVGVF